MVCISHLSCPIELAKPGISPSKVKNIAAPMSEPAIDPITTRSKPFIGLNQLKLRSLRVDEETSPIWVMILSRSETDSRQLTSVVETRDN